MNAPDLGVLGLFSPKAPHAYLGRDLPEGQPTQGDELTRLIWLLVDEQRLPRRMLSSLHGSTIIEVHPLVKLLLGLGGSTPDLCWDRRRRRRSSWS